MFSKLIFLRLKSLLQFQISVSKFYSSSSLKKERNYIFREVRNNSIIRDFAFGLINPQLLRMPNPPPSDSVINELMTQLDNLPNDLPASACLEQLKELGVFGATIPSHYGGLGFSLTDYMMLLQHKRLVDWVMPLTVHQNLCAQTIVLYGSEDQKNWYLPRLASGEMIGGFCVTENSSGSDMMMMETVATLDTLEEHYIVDGTKNWVVNGAVADVLVVVARTEDCKYEGGRPHLTAMIVDRHVEGVSVSDMYHVPCLPHSQIANVILHDVCVPVTNVLYEDHGGYKIANHIQNNARCMVAAMVVSSMRVLVHDLVDRDKKGHLDGHNTLVRTLVEECLSVMYAVESALMFTCKFHDMYQVAEIEMESAVLKVFSTEAAHTIVDNYLRVLSLMKCVPVTEMVLVCDRVSYLHSFLGSNYFVRLYIGGTMEQMCEHSLSDKKDRLNSPTDNFSFKLKSRGIKWTTDVGDAQISMIVNSSHFKEEMLAIFRRLNDYRQELVTAICRYKEKTLECQKIMEAMSRLAELTYVVSCCVARVNSDHGDYELACTERMLDRTKHIMDTIVPHLMSVIKEGSSPLVNSLAHDIVTSKGFPPGNVLCLQSPPVPIVDPVSDS